VVYGLLGVTGFYLIAKNALNGPEVATTKLENPAT